MNKPPFSELGPYQKFLPALALGSLCFAFGATQTYEHAANFIDPQHDLAFLPGAIIKVSWFNAASSVVLAAVHVACKQPFVKDVKTCFIAAAIGLSTGVVETSVMCMALGSDSRNADVVATMRTIRVPPANFL